MQTESIALPKVGIRPTIDGRSNGVRESLEEQTMAMARRAAQLISSKLRHSDGSPVECVIAHSTIGGRKEGALCEEQFAREGVGVSITVTPCWCYGTETMDYDPQRPKAVWGFNGTERPGAVYLAALLAAHNQQGLPAFGIYGEDVQDKSDTSIPADVEEKLLRFTRAGLAVARMRGSSYLAIGGTSMGIAGSIVNPSFLYDYLGMVSESVDMCELTRRIEHGIFDQEEFTRAQKWVKEYCVQGTDYNKPEMQRKDKYAADWDYVIKMTMIARDLMEGNPKLAELGYPEEALGHNAIAAGFQGQRQWTDYLPNGDFMETMLNSSFDWNGIREPMVMATENDYLNGITMLFGHLLTNRAQIFSDVRTYWSPKRIEEVSRWKPTGLAENGLIHLINSGSTTMDGTGAMTEDNKPIMKHFWDMTDADAQVCLEATRFHPANTGYFRGGGFSTCFLSKGNMPLTMSRLNIIKGQGPVLQIVEGYSVEIPQEAHDIINKRTDPSWPTTWFAPRLTESGPCRSVYSVMDYWGANHGAISYGHIGADLITLASLLRIPVSMHNVAEDKIFRPSAWKAFGMDLEGADFRSCENFGPLYGKA